MKIRPLLLPRLPARRDGYALVLMLAFLVLLTGLIVAFFSRAATERQVSNSGAHKTKSDMLARSALDMIVGDFKQEIVNGSVAGSTTAFAPNTPADMVPKQSGVPATPTGSTPPIPNLVRRSLRNDPLYNATPRNVSVAASAVNSTSDLSQNGRWVNLARWNSHYLIPRHNTGTTIDSTPISPLNTSSPEANGFTPPDWVMVTKTGPKVLSAPDQDTIGRYAYAVYNEGGLLDANVAGYPSGLTPEQISLKGSQVFADLTKMTITSSGTTLSQSDLDQIIGWRNNATTQAKGSLGSYAFNTAGTTSFYESMLSSNGFLTVSPKTFPFPATAASRTDQKFTSRQALLDFRRSSNGPGSAGFSQNALQYLGTSSLALNTPSWEPRMNASALGGADAGIDPITASPISSAYAYKDNADSTSAINRRLSNVLVINTFTRLDGTTANVGEPLILNRFDLSKLAWLRADGTLPTGVTAADILNYFGLARNPTGSWTYNHGSATGIKTLDEVANASREPDFFELLQAGILKGSLGLNSGDPSAPADANKGGEFYRLSQAKKGMFDWRGGALVRSDNNGVVYAQGKYQIIQIGANIIDQSDVDSFPTDIVLNGEHFYGTENLPYLNAIGDTCYRPAPGAEITPNTYQAYVHQWLTMSLWNPHQNATLASPDAPAKFRVFTSQGQVVTSLQNTPTVAHSPVPPWNLGKDFNATNAWVAFNINDYPGRFSEPTMLDYDRTAADQVSEPSGRVKGGTDWKRVGLYMGWSYSPDIAQKVAACAPVAADAPKSVLYNAAHITFSVPLILDLQYQDSAGNWQTYQELRGLVFGRDGRGDPYMEPKDPAWSTNVSSGSFNGPLTLDQEAWVLSFLDPRAPRLNMSPRKGLKLAQNANDNDVDSFPPYGPRFPLTPGAWKNWVNNSSTATSYYTDRDAVRRVGDAAGWASADPLPSGRNTQRPLVLNRPFRSVGELGYVFRDDPWKSLNFISASAPATTPVPPTSADAALLDIFCVGPVPATAAPTPRAVAGKVNINAASVPVLQALMASTARDYKSSDPTQVSGTISSAESLDIATDLVKKVQTNGPLVNIAEITGLFPSDTSVNARYPGNKAQREAAIRGLADTCTTRNWNLLIDVIAQSGRYGPQPKALKDFVVEGETRYWLHVAIDRFTGQVVGRQLELVSE